MNFDIIFVFRSKAIFFYILEFLLMHYAILCDNTTYKIKFNNEFKYFILIINNFYILVIALYKKEVIM